MQEKRNGGTPVEQSTAPFWRCCGSWADELGLGRSHGHGHGLGLWNNHDTLRVSSFSQWARQVTCPDPGAFSVNAESWGFARTVTVRTVKGFCFCKAHSVTERDVLMGAENVYGQPKAVNNCCLQRHAWFVKRSQKWDTCRSQAKSGLLPFFFL